MFSSNRLTLLLVCVMRIQGQTDQAATVQVKMQNRSDAVHHISDDDIAKIAADVFAETLSDVGALGSYECAGDCTDDSKCNRRECWGCDDCDNGRVPVPVGLSADGTPKYKNDGTADYNNGASCGGGTYQMVQDSAAAGIPMKISCDMCRRYRDGRLDTWWGNNDGWNWYECVYIPSYTTNEAGTETYPNGRCSARGYVKEMAETNGFNPWYDEAQCSNTCADSMFLCPDGQDTIAPDATISASATYDDFTVKCCQSPTAATPITVNYDVIGTGWCSIQQSPNMFLPMLGIFPYFGGVSGCQKLCDLVNDKTHTPEGYNCVAVSCGGEDCLWCGIHLDRYDKIEDLKWKVMSDCSGNWKWGECEARGSGDNWPYCYKPAWGSTKYCDSKTAFVPRMYNWQNSGCEGCDYKTNDECTTLGFSGVSRPYVQPDGLSLKAGTVTNTPSVCLRTETITCYR